MVELLSMFWMVFPSLLCVQSYLIPYALSYSLFHHSLKTVTADGGFFAVAIFFLVILGNIEGLV